MHLPDLSRFAPWKLMTVSAGTGVLFVAFFVGIGAWLALALHLRP